MASPAEIIQGLPDTLPDDFNDWDGGSSPAPIIEQAGGVESSPVVHEAPKPPVQAIEREAITKPVVEESRAARPTVPVVVVHQQHTNGAALEGFTKRPSQVIAAKEAAKAPIRTSIVPPDARRDTPEGRAAARREVDAILFQSFSAAAAAQDEEEAEKSGAGFMQKLKGIASMGQKGMIITAVSAVSTLILVIYLFPMFHHNSKAMANQSVQPRLETVNTQVSNEAKPDASTPMVQDQPVVATEKPTAIPSQPTPQAAAAQPAVEQPAPAQKPQVQSQMMNDQLNAPALISKDAKTQVAEAAPPPAGFGSANAEGMGGGGAVGNVFGGHAQSVVVAPPARPLSVSAGVASGLLIQKVAPMYPQIAKTARVSGTVELQATISTAGTIKDLRVVNGPTMLRQAAYDAVKSWRYKPYRLNNEPTEIQTTIDVIFSLAG